jgi:hypothetical protein
MKRAESVLQAALIEHLRLRAVPGLVYFAVPNNPRNRVAGGILKRMGMTAGVSDLILLHKGQAYALELKTEKGRATDSQLAFLKSFREAGGIAQITYGLDPAISFLERQGLIR